MDFTREELKTLCRSLHGYIEALDRDADDCNNVGETAAASGKYAEMNSAENILDRVRSEISRR